jgi:hypothetical protein
MEHKSLGSIAKLFLLESDSKWIHPLDPNDRTLNMNIQTEKNTHTSISRTAA